MAKFPGPPAMLLIPADAWLARAGATWWRVYFTGGARPAAWDAFRGCGPTTSRFDHQLPPASVQAREIFYAAADPTTCLAEVFQATRVIDRSARAPWL